MPVSSHISFCMMPGTSAPAPAVCAAGCASLAWAETSSGKLTPADAEVRLALGEMSASAGQHGAAGSALGYLFQVQWALLALLRRVRQAPDAAMSFEVLDDIQFDDPMELVQVKHHLGDTATLTDNSVDLWRTLAVWMDAGENAQGPEDVPAALMLVTTARTGEGSAAALLGPTERQPQLASDLLTEAATNSTNQETAAARAQFLGWRQRNARRSSRR